ncbi:MAG: TetR/AcrR family transcriptional regulator [Akkermansia sp.]
MQPKKTQSERSAETSRRILDASQKLFAERGYEGVSMREVASAAQVNLASIIYYFDSKEGLYLGVIMRYSKAIEEARECSLKIADENPSMENYIRAFIEPAFKIMTDASLGGPTHALLLWRAPHEPAHLWDKFYKNVYAPVTEQYIHKIRSFCPDISETDFSWSCHMMSSLFFSTLGKCAHDRNWEHDIWLGDSEYIMKRLVQSMAVILRELSQKS